MSRRVVKGLQHWCCSALLVVGSLAGVGAAQGFDVSVARYVPPTDATCDALVPQLETLERLLGMRSTPQLAFTRAIPLRQQEYEALESRLSALSVRPLPFSAAELAPVPRPSMPSLRREYTVRYETVPDPEYWALGPLILGVISGYLGLRAYSVDEDPTFLIVGGSLGVAFGWLGVWGLSRTRRVEHRDPVPAAVSANAATRRQYEQEVARIERENAEREARRREQQAVEEENRAIEETRNELLAAMSAFEPESRFVAEWLVPELDDMTLRCLEQLIYGGAIARVGSSSALVSLAVTPVNRAGAVMYEADPESAFRFSVRDVGLFGASARLGGAPGGVIRAVRPFDPSEFDATPVAAMLVIDSSGSMRDNDPRGARSEGVVRFLASAPANAYIGLMEFSGSGGRLLAPISQDFASLRQAASVISASGGTPLYASGLDALAHLAEHGMATRQVLVMLSDGLDEHSHAGARDELLLRAREQRVPIYAIGLGSVDFSDFEDVALSTGGAFVHAQTADDVVTALEQLARVLSAAYVIDVEVPVTARQGDVDGEVSATISAQHEGITASAEASGYIRLIQRD